MSDGDRGFPRGANVIQFGYSDPGGQGYFNVDIYNSANSTNRFYHSFEKLGNRPSKEYLAEMEALLSRNNKVLAYRCGLKFSPGDFGRG